MGLRAIDTVHALRQGQVAMVREPPCWTRIAATGRDLDSASRATLLDVEVSGSNA